MAFFEAEICRALGFQRVGGPAFSTYIVAVQSEHETRNRNWQNPRAEYTASLKTPAHDASGNPIDPYKFVEDIRTFFLLLGGMADAFRLYDILDHSAVAQTLGVIDATHYQLQKTYSLGGRSYVRKITKPITSDVIDYQGNPIVASVVLKNGGGSVVAGTIDHTTGIVTSANSPVTATFDYDIPVRLNTDKFEPQIIAATRTSPPIINWTSLSLKEVRPPNY